MSVSRETKFTHVLSVITDSLSIDNNFLSSNQSFSELTAPAASMLLFAINSISKIPLVVLCEDNATAEHLYKNAYNFLFGSVAYFPGLSTNSLDIPGFNLEDERYRSEAVNFVRKDRHALIFSSSESANELTIESDVSEKENSFQLSTGKNIHRQALLSSLTMWGYESVDRTETPKTFSVRGGILDVFLPYSASPIRIEFFGDLVESIRMFNPRSQRTVKTLEVIEILPPPIITNNIDNKISLLKLAGNRQIKITKQGHLFEIFIRDNSNNNCYLDCVGVHFWDTQKTSHSVSIKTVFEKLKPQHIYIFSEKTIPQKTMEKYRSQNVQIVPNFLESSFCSKQLNICCLSIADIDDQKPIFRSRWAVDSIAEIPQKEFSSLDDLDWGDYLVHEDFGIGLYRGLEKINTRDSVEQECIKIEYAANASVYVPVDRFNRVHRMLITGDRKPVLSTLNSPRWGRQKQVAKDSAKLVVKDLVNLYTARNNDRGFIYNKNNEFMHELAMSFPYQETPGQKAAIDAVVADMEKGNPVDRLVCGDVGFGKTEVALRAALKSIISGKKVLFLTPTTILADQHYISTQARLEPLGVRIELLSRFKTKKQQQAILEKMLTGDADLVIGTHRLLSQDVNFPNLGLLIIDEEHRFGVKHKEKLRQWRTTLDVLTLTATPIPRTLQQSLLGIRDISRISTPPKMRQPIKTFVKYFDWNNIVTIVNNELNRNGQIYYLHNDIASIPFIYKKLNALFPNSTVGVAHSKMNSKELETTILAFFSGKVQILLCTTIIESGLDVPNANTLIINNAQNFGLSQLYQIRGRVGRSHQQAYCYLLLPRGKAIGESARKRLKAIEQFTSLGTGYEISLKDLEIRGAGNLFGYKQSGHMAAVGFEMYCKLLQEAVDESLCKSELQQSPNITIAHNAMLESDYIPLVQDRLYFYQQLSDVTDIVDVNKIQDEMVDRFGRLPKSATHLIDITEYRVCFLGTSVKNVVVVGSGVKINLNGFAPFSSVTELITTVEQKLFVNNYKYKFSTSSDGLLVEITSNNLEHSLKAVNIFVELFSK